MTKTIEAYAFHDDLPKENPWKEDRLGYKPFCEQLAKVILNLTAPNGYVIGLHGEWGSGKSTGLNFIRAFLDKHNQEAEHDSERITLVDFRPWIISGHQDLIAAFFKIMAESIGDQPGFWKRQWRRAMRAFKIGGDPLVDAVATVAVTVDPSGTVGAASKATAPLFKKSLGALVDNFLAEPSLQMAHEELKKRLTERKQRFLVTIDDIDRLQDNEINSIMQMVKTVGRLPNAIYLLAYDRAIVWDALDGKRSKGPRFGEKIVQQEIELPQSSKDLLLGMLDEETAFLNVHIEETTRWHYIVSDGIRRWIRHPRDVLRIANALKFSWAALEGEIDPADLYAMEGLRLFDSKVFDWIRWNRDFLFFEGRYTMAAEDTKTQMAKLLKDSLPEDTHEETLRILAILFPEHAETFEGKHAIREESATSTAARRGVGYLPGYDAYFGLHPSPDAIPKSIVDSITVNLANTEVLSKIIEPYLVKTDRRGQPVIGQLLQEVRYRFYGRHSLVPTKEFLDLLFDYGERILALEWNAEVFVSSPRAHLSFLIAELLQIWGKNQAGRHLLASFKKSSSAVFCAGVFVDRARELGKMPFGDSSPPTITEPDLQLLGNELLPKIERSANDGTLAKAPFYFHIVAAWSYMGKANEAKAWLSSGMLNSAEFLAKATMGLVSYSISNNGREYSMRELPDSSLYDPQILKVASKKHLAGDQLNRDQRSRIRAVNDGIDKLTEQTRRNDPIPQ